VQALIQFTPNGPFCPDGDFYIDPYRRVPKALITHAHADHARKGMGRYLSHHHNKGILQSRLDANLHFQGIHYGEELQIGGVKVCFYPAGHIPGSSMITIERKGEIWCFSGDYKCEDDGLSTPVEFPSCHVFITESTFALPVFDWKPQKDIFEEMHLWIREQFAQGISVVLFAYSLGKAQRLLYHLKEFQEKTVVHPTILKLNEVLINEGYPLSTAYLTEIKKAEKPLLYIMPPAASSDAKLKQLEPYAIARASGWSALRGMATREGINKGFIISDHTDWKGILHGVKETGAQKIYATHGYSAVLTRYLQECGWDAVDLRLHPLEGEEDSEKAHF
jgi:putative mRNA 3-end processing factor